MVDGPGRKSAKTGPVRKTSLPHDTYDRSEDQMVYATGDASISAAMANGGITRIHHVDQETTNILGIYAKYVTIVHGE
jgi:TRL-like protein family